MEIKRIKKLPKFGSECNCENQNQYGVTQEIHKGNRDEIINYCNKCGGVVWSR